MCHSSLMHHRVSKTSAHDDLIFASSQPSMLALAVLGCDLKVLTCDWLSTLLNLQTLAHVSVHSFLSFNCLQHRFDQESCHCVMRLLLPSTLLLSSAILYAFLLRSRIHITVMALKSDKVDKEANTNDIVCRWTDHGHTNKSNNHIWHTGNVTDV